MIIAFDFDGTLCNIEHRLHHIQKKPANWVAFFADCVDDAPITPVIEACHAMVLAGHRVEIWSGRSDIVRAESEAWLNRHAIGYKTLRMRKNGDYRADNIVKAEWLDALPAAERPVIAFDDRQQVVDMWRRHGVICCQVAPGDF